LLDSYYSESSRRVPTPDSTRCDPIFSDSQDFGQVKFYGFGWSVRHVLHIRVWSQADSLALPTVILNSPAVSDLSRGGDNPSFGTGRDIAGIILFAIGFFWEAVSDIQKVFLFLMAIGQKADWKVPIQIVETTKRPTMYQRIMVFLKTSSLFR
jgi:hypothetical protein